ncbi:unnamed protein product [Trichogramma brassicae]|uniref:Uncharacterized protein n=1 Tax=Trichogramma brassicae TaxID=86971 RepID=A0A6H5J8T7_9HYME|nr:unnamed protein product [Trichogramma brassicae]
MTHSGDVFFPPSAARLTIILVRGYYPRRLFDLYSTAYSRENRKDFLKNKKTLLKMGLNAHGIDTVLSSHLCPLFRVINRIFWYRGVRLAHERSECDAMGHKITFMTRFSVAKVALYGTASFASHFRCTRALTSLRGTRKCDSRLGKEIKLKPPGSNRHHFPSNHPRVTCMHKCDPGRSWTDLQPKRTYVTDEARRGGDGEAAAASTKHKRRRRDTASATVFRARCKALPNSNQLDVPWDPETDEEPEQGREELERDDTADEKPRDGDRPSAGRWCTTGADEGVFTPQMIAVLPETIRREVNCLEEKLVATTVAAPQRGWGLRSVHLLETVDSHRI